MATIHVVGGYNGSVNHPNANILSSYYYSSLEKSDNILGPLNFGLPDSEEGGSWYVSDDSAGGSVKVTLPHTGLRITRGYKRWRYKPFVGFISEWVEDNTPPWCGLSFGENWVQFTIPYGVPSSDSVWDRAIFTIAYLGVDSDVESDPNNPIDPNPDQEPEPGSINNLYCKMNGQVRKAKQLFTKQNGVIVPVRSIHTK